MAAAMQGIQSPPAHRPSAPERPTAPPPQQGDAPGDRPRKAGASAGVNSSTARHSARAVYSRGISGSAVMSLTSDVVGQCGKKSLTLGAADLQLAGAHLYGALPQLPHLCQIDKVAAVAPGKGAVCQLFLKGLEGAGGGKSPHRCKSAPGAPRFPDNRCLRCPDGAARPPPARSGSALPAFPAGQPP